MSGFDGMDAVLAKLKKLDRELQGPATKAMLSAAASQAEGYVKENAREEFYTGQDRGQTGNLLNSIQSDGDSNESVVYVGAEYGEYLERGTYSGGGGSFVGPLQPGVKRGIQARHYVYRGVMEHLPEIRDAGVRTLKRILGT